jgi:hypothetical protein
MIFNLAGIVVLGGEGLSQIVRKVGEKGEING